MNEDKREIKTINANKYLNKQEQKYIFPINILDDIYGRIEIHIEIFYEKRKRNGLKYIEKIWLWFQQTEDKRYDGKVFEIPMLTEQLWIDTENISGNQTVRACDKHKNTIIWFYPKNDVKQLEIDTQSTILRNISLK